MDLRAPTEDGPLNMLLPLLVSLAPLQGPPQTGLPLRPRRPNIVLVLADDFGVDLVGAYGEGTDPPCTPTLDGLAQEGLLFRNAWTNPICTPSRAATLTGRHGFRTGVGSVGQGSELPLAETIVPEALPDYASSAVGKWHLARGSSEPQDHPNDSGFQHYAGGLGGGVGDYFSWTKVVDGQSSVSTTYATTDTADEAIAAVLVMPEPWFLYVSFNAPHAPFHVPPASVCALPSCGSTWCANLPNNPSNRDRGKAMVEAMDAELGRVLEVVDALDPEAFVFFMGDNGTAGQLSEAPFANDHAKGTVYEGGVNVPLMVRGPGVVQGECAGLVSSVDLFTTFTDLAGFPAVTEDSRSLVPYFRNPGLSLREFVYAERFSPNGGAPPFADHRRAVRGARYKLLRQTGQPDELYDLLVDPFETVDLLPNPTPDQQAAYVELVAELVRLGVD